MAPGSSPTFAKVRGAKFSDKLDFLSLMLALFCGTASLPHILIRYYTIKDELSARKSTVVGIAAIGFFYVLTLFFGLGAMTSGALDVTDSNMSAPLLARSINELLFAVLSAVAFTTILGTVSGLIMAASGAVAHDIMGSFMNIEMDDHAKVRAGKIASVPTKRAMPASCQSRRAKRLRSPYRCCQPIQNLERKIKNPGFESRRLRLFRPSRWRVAGRCTRATAAGCDPICEKASGGWIGLVSRVLPPGASAGSAVVSEPGSGIRPKYARWQHDQLDRKGI